MKEDIAKEKQEEVKKLTIVSEPAFCMKALIAKRVEGKENKKHEEGGIKLFDFGGDSQIKESFVDNDEKEDPLEEPKLFLNIVYCDQVLPPLNKNLDISGPDNDRDWHIIPIAFTEPQYRKSLDGLQCIHYDGHVNTCVVDKMKEGDRTFKAIMNYIVKKF